MDAARLEGSKVFAKDFMQRNRIPTARYRTFDEFQKAQEYLDSVDHDVVIKADGLAAGKGVIVPSSKTEAHKALKEIMLEREFGDAGRQVVIEEYLEGDELSVLTFCDGYTIRSLPPAQDHKRINEGDLGPNTGGMGCYAPTKIAPNEKIVEIDRTIVQPTIDAMRRERTPFVGLLFTGLMMTESGPRVLEYNVRGGDPETQTLLPLLSADTDLAEVMVACTEHWLDAVNIKIERKFSVTVVVSAEGYPGPYKKNRTVYLDPLPSDTLVFHAGTAVTHGVLTSTGGRVIAATSTGTTLEAAVQRAYDGMNSIRFEGMHYRRDIAHRALKVQSTEPTTFHSTEALTYATAGVSIDAGNALVSQIKPLVRATARSGADAVLGGFGGAFKLSQAGFGDTAPTIISAIDGVGTKLKVAHALNKHDTVGIDLVAMNVNDLIVQGAEPLVFLDCFSCSKLDVQMTATVVRGITDGCKLARCALVGGETAEMAGLYQDNEYDLVGVSIGAVPHTRTILPDVGNMVEGDILLGLASSGVHSNGFSLIRKVIDHRRLSLLDPAPWAPQTSLGLSLLTPTKIYVRSLLEIVENGMIKGMSHITGGGLVENVPRMLPEHLTAEIDVASWKIPTVFSWLQAAGNIPSEEMSRVFNNGIGMVLVVSDIASGELAKRLEVEGETVHKIGKLIRRQAGKAHCTLKNMKKWDEASAIWR